MIIPQSLFRQHSWTWPLALPKISWCFNSAAPDSLSGLCGFQDSIANQQPGLLSLLGPLRGNSGEKNKGKKARRFYFGREEIESGWHVPLQRPAHPAAAAPCPSTAPSLSLVASDFFFFGLFWTFPLALVCLIYNLGRRLDVKRRKFVGFSNRQRQRN